MDMSQVLKAIDGSYIRKNTVSGKCFHIIGEPVGEPVETKNFSSQETQTGVVVHIKVEEEGGRNLLPVFLPHSEGDVCNREVKAKTNQNAKVNYNGVKVWVHIVEINKDSKDSQTHHEDDDDEGWTYVGRRNPPKNTEPPQLTEKKDSKDSKDMSWTELLYRLFSNESCVPNLPEFLNYLRKKNYENPTKAQKELIIRQNCAQTRGKDTSMVVHAAPGSGKTLGFLICALNRININAGKPQPEKKIIRINEDSESYSLEDWGSLDRYKREKFSREFAKNAQNAFQILILVNTKKLVSQHGEYFKELIQGEYVHKDLRVDLIGLDDDVDYSESLDPHGRKKGTKVRIIRHDKDETNSVSHQMIEDRWKGIDPNYEQPPNPQYPHIIITTPFKAAQLICEKRYEVDPNKPKKVDPNQNEKVDPNQNEKNKIKPLIMHGVKFSQGNLEKHRTLLSTWNLQMLIIDEADRVMENKDFSNILFTDDEIELTQGNPKKEYLVHGIRKQLQKEEERRRKKAQANKKAISHLNPISVLAVSGTFDNDKIEHWNKTPIELCQDLKPLGLTDLTDLTDLAAPNSSSQSSRNEIKKMPYYYLSIYVEHIKQFLYVIDDKMLDETEILRVKVEKAIEICEMFSGGENGNNQIIIFVKSTKDQNMIFKYIKDKRRSEPFRNVFFDFTKDPELFMAGRRRICIATNKMAQGVDVMNLRVVIQLDPTRASEYIQKVGRTGRRRGERGASVLFVTENELTEDGEHYDCPRTLVEKHGQWIESFSEKNNNKTLSKTSDRKPIASDASDTLNQMSSTSQTEHSYREALIAPRSPASGTPPPEENFPTEDFSFLPGGERNCIEFYRNHHQDYRVESFRISPDETNYYENDEKDQIGEFLKNDYWDKAIKVLEENQEEEIKKLGNQIKESSNKMALIKKELKNTNFDLAQTLQKIDDLNKAGKFNLEEKESLALSEKAKEELEKLCPTKIRELYRKKDIYEADRNDFEKKRDKQREEQEGGRKRNIIDNIIIDPDKYIDDRRKKQFDRRVNGNQNIDNRPNLAGNLNIYQADILKSISLAKEKTTNQDERNETSDRNVQISNQNSLIRKLLSVGTGFLWENAPRPDEIGTTETEIGSRSDASIKDVNGTSETKSSQSTDESKDLSGLTNKIQKLFNDCLDENKIINKFREFNLKCRVKNLVEKKQKQLIDEGLLTLNKLKEECTKDFPQIRIKGSTKFPLSVGKEAAKERKLEKHLDKLTERFKVSVENRIDEYFESFEEDTNLKKIKDRRFGEIEFPNIDIEQQKNFLMVVYEYFGEEKNSFDFMRFNKDDFNGENLNQYPGICSRNESESFCDVFPSNFELDEEFTEFTVNTPRDILQMQENVVITLIKFLLWKQRIEVRTVAQFFRGIVFNPRGLSEPAFIDGVNKAYDDEEDQEE